MTTSLMVFHAIISVLLIVSVLLQFGKGAEAGLFSQADSVMTGAQQGNILSKITTFLTVVFIANCLILAKMQSGKETKSILDGEAPIAAPLSSDANVPSTAPAKADAPKAMDAKKVETATEPKAVEAKKVDEPKAIEAKKVEKK